jgi:acylphosphatase
MQVTRHLRIVGLVQGVGYRESMVAQARIQGVLGWVRNRSDGSVEAILVGTEPEVQALIVWSRRGPTACRVDEITISEMTSADVADRFERRPTV